MTEEDENRLRRTITQNEYAIQAKRNTIALLNGRLERLSNAIVNISDISVEIDETRMTLSTGPEDSSRSDDWHGDKRTWWNVQIDDLCRYDIWNYISDVSFVLEEMERKYSEIEAEIEGLEGQIATLQNKNRTYRNVLNNGGIGHGK